MQEYGVSLSNKSQEYRECVERECSQESPSYPLNQRSFFQKNPVYPNTEFEHCTGATENETALSQSHRYNDSPATFGSPPNSPLIGLVFDPSLPNFSGSSTMSNSLNPDRRSQSSWSASHQEPIGTGVRKKIVKNQEKRNVYNADPRYQDKYKETETDSRKKNKNLSSESTSSLDFFVEGERMVSELCNIPDPNSRNDMSIHKSHLAQDQDEKNRNIISSEILLTALDKIVIHDQIPNQIVQLAIEACTDAENIAIAHHNRPCFKNIHSICAKTRSNVQKPDSAVANLHSQGIPWVIKNFIFSFVRILDGWKGVKELLSEKHDTFSRIENKYYSQNIRECFVQWQAVTKEMLTHIYKTFKCLDYGFIMEQKSFTHNYYATNSAAPRHQNQNKFQPIKPHINTPRTINSAPLYNVIQPPWLQPQARPPTPQNYNESSWPIRTNVGYKKIPVVPPQSSNFYSANDHTDTETYQKNQYKCDPCCIRESKPRQSWTIANISDCRIIEGICRNEQRELYSQLKHKIDAELGKPCGQPIMGNNSGDLLQRREMELKAKMIPLSHVEKNLIPSMTQTGEVRTYLQKNNSCGDTKEEADFFAAWGQMVQNEPSEFLTHQSHNIQIPSNIVTICNNNSGPVKFLETDNDEFHEISKVYMKPGSYKVPIKPVDNISSYVQNVSQDAGNADNNNDDIPHSKTKPFLQITLAPQPKYNVDSWPCLISRRSDDLSMDDQFTKPIIDTRKVDSFDLINSMISDQAWEAAKQSAPKLMDFIHGGSRTDTARLYDALSLSTNEEIVESLKLLQKNADSNNAWESNSTPKSVPTEWNQTPMVRETSRNKTEMNDSITTSEDISNILAIGETKTTDVIVQEDSLTKNEETRENVQRRNFDQTGSYIKEESSQKKSSGKSKVAVSGTWYHPKKRKPLSNTLVKKFENIITSLTRLNEADFIQHDMDIKVAPRFYEVVKHPMCLNDISTKLMNSSYTEFDQVVQDFRRIFNNVRLYLKNYPDATMKKHVNKVSSEFEKILSQEFPNKWESKSKGHESEIKDQINKKNDKESSARKPEIKKEELKSDFKLNADDKQ